MEKEGNVLVLIVAIVAIVAIFVIVHNNKAAAPVSNMPEFSPQAASYDAVDNQDLVGQAIKTARSSNHN